MAYVYNFCFYFSLRLGAIIIGIFSLFQGLIMTILFGIGLSNAATISEQMSVWKEEYDLIFMASIFDAVLKDPEKQLVLAVTASSLYTLTCVILIYGSYKFNTFMIYPYVVFEFLRLILLIAAHVVYMMLVKQNVINLGLLIGLCVLGGFILLGLVYMWVCVLSLLQIIKELKREIEISNLSTFPKVPSSVPNVYTVNKNKERFEYFTFNY